MKRFHSVIFLINLKAQRIEHISNSDRFIALCRVYLSVLILFLQILILNYLTHFLISFFFSPLRKVSQIDALSVWCRQSKWPHREFYVKRIRLMAVNRIVSSNYVTWLWLSTVWFECLISCTIVVIWWYNSVCCTLTGSFILVTFNNWKLTEPKITPIVFYATTKLILSFRDGLTSRSQDW